MFLVIIEQWSRKYQEAKLTWPYRSEGPMGMWTPRQEIALYRVEKDETDLIVTFLFGGYPRPIVFPVKNKEFKTLTTLEMVKLALGGRFTYSPDPRDEQESHLIEVIGFDHPIIGEAMKFYGLEKPEDLLLVSPNLVLVENNWGRCNAKVAGVG